jgi:HEPN domain-containing protein
LPRKTESHCPADWLWIATADLELVQLAVEPQVGFHAARAKLAEVLEKILNAELLRLGLVLEKTHDLDRLLELLRQHRSPAVGTAEPLCDQLAEVYFTDRYPGFDFDDPDWAALGKIAGQVAALWRSVQAQLPPPPTGTPGASY